MIGSPFNLTRLHMESGLFEAANKNTPSAQRSANCVADFLGQLPCTGKVRQYGVKLLRHQTIKTEYNRIAKSLLEGEGKATS